MQKCGYANEAYPHYVVIRAATVCPYVGIIQIRLKGLGDTAHSQPAPASSPVDGSMIP